MASREQRDLNVSLPTGPVPQALKNFTDRLHSSYQPRGANTFSIRPFFFSCNRNRNIDTEEGPILDHSY